jgi:WD40 repeat protein
LYEQNRVPGAGVRIIRDSLVVQAGLTPLQDVTYCCNGRTVVSAGGREGIVRIWDADSWIEVDELDAESGFVHDVACASESTIMVSTHENGLAAMWDMNDRALVGQIDFRGVSELVHNLTAIAVSDDARLMIARDTFGAVAGWNIEEDKEAFFIKGNGDPGLAAVFDPVSVGVWGNAGVDVVLWQIPNGKVLNRLSGHQGGVEDIELLSEEGQLLSADETGSVYRWDLQSGSVLDVFRHQGRRVASIDVSPCGRLLACGIADSKRFGLLNDGEELEDSTIRIWDLDLAQEICHLVGHEKGVSGVTFSPDGLSLVSVSWDRTLRVWNLESVYEQLQAARY